MSKLQEKNRERSRSRLTLLAVLLILLALGGLVWWLVNSGRIRTEEPRAERYNFASEKSTVTCVVEDGFAVASATGLQVYSRTGLQTVGEMFVARTPILVSRGKYGICYDVDGNTVRLFTEGGIVNTLKTEGGIISAEVSAGGLVTVCARESGYKGSVTVYNLSGNVAYKWLSGEAYVLAARLNRDGKKLAVLTITESGSRVVYLDTDKEKAGGETLLEGELLLDISYCGGDTLYGISSDALYRLGEGKTPLVLDSYPQFTLAGYSFEGGCAYALNAYRTGGACEIRMLRDDAVVSLGSFEDGFVSLSADTRHVAVLTAAALTVMGRGEEADSAYYEEASAGLSVGLTEDGNAIVTGRNTARVFPCDP